MKVVLKTQIDFIKDVLPRGCLNQNIVNKAS